MADTATTTEVPNLTGAARDAAVKLANLGSKVFTEITAGGIAHVNATITAILALQPTLNAELTQCKRDNPTRDVGQGLFHTHMTKLINRVGDDSVTWQLDAPTTWLAASFKREARAWTAYQNLIGDTGKVPTLAAFAEFQRRFKLGHYTGRGVLTDVGKRYDDEQRDEAFKDATRKVKRFSDIDWAGFAFDEGDAPVDEDWLQFFHELEYFAHAEVLKREKRLRKSSSGKTIVSNARSAAKDALGLS